MQISYREHNFILLKLGALDLKGPGSLLARALERMETGWPDMS